MSGDDDVTSQLASDFADLARDLYQAGSTQATLERIAGLSTQIVDGCGDAGITLTTRGRLSTPAASGRLPHLVDAIQYETGEGPCLEAIRSHEVYEIDDLEHDQRWPAFALEATRRTAVRSALSFRLFIADDTLGALNMYATRVGAFGPHSRSVGAILAAHAAVALAATEREEHLTEALRTRDVIGQAKGILMARQHVSADEAFDTLRRASQRLNVKLHDIAEQISADAGPAPADPAPRSEVATPLSDRLAPEPGDDAR